MSYMHRLVFEPYFQQLTWLTLYLGYLTLALISSQCYDDKGIEQADNEWTIYHATIGPERIACDARLCDPSWTYSGVFSDLQRRLQHPVVLTGTLQSATLSYRVLSSRAERRMAGVEPGNRVWHRHPNENDCPGP